MHLPEDTNNMLCDLFAKRSLEVDAHWSALHTVKGLHFVFGCIVYNVAVHTHHTSAMAIRIVSIDTDSVRRCNSIFTTPNLLILFGLLVLIVDTLNGSWIIQV